MKKLRILLYGAVLAVCLSACHTALVPAAPDSTASLAESEQISQGEAGADTDTQAAFQSKTSSSVSRDTGKGTETKGGYSISSPAFEESRGISASQATATTKKRITASTAMQTKPSTQHTHTYSEQVIPSSCGVEGYTLHTCSCGYTYRDEITPATYRHTFVTQDEEVEAYGRTVCSFCGLEVCAHGNADGTRSREYPVMYYITGPKYVSESDTIERTLLIYGSGAMPDYGTGGSKEEMLAPWYGGDYYEDVTTVIIADGITTIGKNAFSQDMPNVKTVTIGDDVRSLGWYSLSGLAVKELRLGKNVQHIGHRAICYFKMNTIYWPKALECTESIPNSLECKIIYAGAEDEFMKINVSQTPWINVYETMEEHIARGFYVPQVIYTSW